ncbi:Ribosomal protein S18 acetylase RimI [Jannaschia faecimaris]|uniref:Ribosomal protein S18 acetylase RimI n=1 Tax=Jannaschia faecimaris TaxID=1244108 RepID=A0A1H3UFC1_9RHOB|nr:GNAT family N-acetyltransferase [Jannaschia faecimaris]SDZ61140.1 Ribosomal protein S18 acetylase RimI [Jannaschia faecimaris]
MHVRPLAEDDAAVWQVLMWEGVEDFPSAFLMSKSEVESMTPDRCRSALAQGNTYGVVSHNSELLGFASLHLWSLERIQHRADIGPFFIRSVHQGTGAADVLMQALAAGAQAAGVNWLDLWVAEANKRAQAFYARHGFRPIGRREDAMRIAGVSETDVLMTRHLTPHLEAAGQGG